jgi:threonine synthase
LQPLGLGDLGGNRFLVTLRNVQAGGGGDAALGAAVEALGRADQADLFVLLPRGRVSEVQRRFMTASGAAHAHAIEIDGD